VRLRIDELPPKYQDQAAAQLYPALPTRKAHRKVARIPNAVPEPASRAEPLAADEAQGAGAGRIVVSIERRGTRLLDKDNLYGSVKYLCDGLRYENLIPSDDPEAIDLIVTQRKVCKAEVGTVVVISYP